MSIVKRWHWNKKVWETLV